MHIQMSDHGALDQARKLYDSLREYEHHFNTMELEIRKLASVWLLAVFGAIAFVARGDVPEQALIDPNAMIPLLAVLGCIGLFTLWIQDYVVYHGLMRAVFIMGLRLEHEMNELPPLRSLMMQISGGEGMARYMKLYYIIPQFALAIIASIATALGGWDTAATLFSAAATGVVLVTVWTSRRIHANYVSYARDFELSPPASVPDEFARMMDASNTQVTFANTIARWRHRLALEVAAAIEKEGGRATTSQYASIQRPQAAEAIDEAKAFVFRVLEEEQRSNAADPLMEAVFKVSSDEQMPPLSAASAGILNKLDRIGPLARAAAVHRWSKLGHTVSSINGLLSMAIAWGPMDSLLGEPFNAQKFSAWARDALERELAPLLTHVIQVDHVNARPGDEGQFGLEITYTIVMSGEHGSLEMQLPLP